MASVTAASASSRSRCDWCAGAPPWRRTRRAPRRNSSSLGAAPAEAPSLASAWQRATSAPRARSAGAAPAPRQHQGNQHRGEGRPAGKTVAAAGAPPTDRPAGWRRARGGARYRCCRSAQRRSGARCCPGGARQGLCSPSCQRARLTADATPRSCGAAASLATSQRALRTIARQHEDPSNCGLALARVGSRRRCTGLCSAVTAPTARPSRSASERPCASRRIAVEQALARGVDDALLRATKYSQPPRGAAQQRDQQVTQDQASTNYTVRASSSFPAAVYGRRLACANGLALRSAALLRRNGHPRGFAGIPCSMSPAPSCSACSALPCSWASPGFLNNKRAVDWKLVATGVTLQIAFATLVLRRSGRARRVRRPRPRLRQDPGLRRRRLELHLRRPDGHLEVRLYLRLPGAAHDHLLRLAHGRAVPPQRDAGGGAGHGLGHHQGHARLRRRDHQRVRQRVHRPDRGAADRARPTSRA